MPIRTVTILLHLNPNRGFKIEAKTSPTVQHTDDDVRKLFLEVLQIILPKRFQSFADLGVDQREHRRNLVVVGPFFRLQDTPTIHTIDLADLGRQLLRYRVGPPPAQSRRCLPVPLAGAAVTVVRQDFGGEQPISRHAEQQLSSADE